MPRILVVDDDPDIRLALEDYLRREQYQVEVADTGRAALEKAMNSHFDAVLLDVGLPDRDGIEILVELAGHQPKLPIILLTAFTSLNQSTPLNKLNKAFAYLTKPYSREDIRQVLRRAVLGAKGPGLPQDTSPDCDARVIRRFPSVVQPSPNTTEKTKGPSYQLTLDEYQRLTEYIQLMQFAFDQVPEAILVAGTDKRIRFANQAAYQALGYNKEELEALRIPDIAPNHDNQRYQEHLNELREGKTLSYYTTHRTKHGEHIPVEISVYLLNFHGQEFTCAITKELPSPKHPSDNPEGNASSISHNARRPQTQS
ncbi:MAG: response regulator [Nitrospirota bacterium]|nr:response regulator [Nitrospirota bacterium]MDH5773342.1 response regulator [Nitrospirota bacterium]